MGLPLIPEKAMRTSRTPGAAILEIYDHFPVHYCSWLFCRHAPRNRFRPCHCRNDHCVPPENDSPGRLDWSPLGSWSYHYDSHHRFGSHSVRPCDSQKSGSHNGIVSRGDADSSGSSEPFCNASADNRNSYAITPKNPFVSPAKWKPHQESSAWGHSSRRESGLRCVHRLPNGFCKRTVHAQSDLDTSLIFLVLCSHRSGISLGDDKAVLS